MAMSKDNGFAIANSHTQEMIMSLRTLNAALDDLVNVIGQEWKILSACLVEIQRLAPTVEREPDPALSGLHFA